MVYSIFPRGDKEKVLSQLVNIQDDYPTFIVSDPFKRTSRKPGHMYTGFFHLSNKINFQMHTLSDVSGKV